MQLAGEFAKDLVKCGGVGDHGIGDAVDGGVGDLLLRVDQGAPAIALPELTVDDDYPELDNAVTFGA